MDWIGQIALATLIVGLFAWLRADLTSTRKELRGDIGKQSTELRGDIQRQGAELRGECRTWERRWPGCASVWRTWKDCLRVCATQWPASELPEAPHGAFRIPMPFL